MKTISEIVLTDHAVRRAKERLKIPEATAQRWATNKLKGKEATAQTGLHTYEYEVDGVTFIVSHQNKKASLITCYKTINDPLRKKVSVFLDRELRKAKRTYNVVNKEILCISAKLYSQISDETAKLARTTNPKAVLKISENLKKLNSELEKAQLKRDEAEKELDVMGKQISKILDS
ncbi:hypothetical protein HCJ67_00500 [Listeria marthii]|uniref:hypothetical protein n=1 Tax=Listeria marthii TaxID=529731 RepID=UPI001628DDF9|nr:hypothetical protein [Listeria marthii]MBC1996782.1 hypothetical protein [Listeria marthii]